MEPEWKMDREEEVRMYSLLRARREFRCQDRDAAHTPIYAWRHVRVDEIPLSKPITEYPNDSSGARRFIRDLNRGVAMLDQEDR